MYIFIILFSIFSAFACRTDQISIVRHTGLGANTNGNHSGMAAQKVNIPVNFEGNWGCWEQEGGLTFDVTAKSRKMTVIVPKSSFEKLPGRTMSYASLKKNNSGLVEMDIATFVCIGNNVIAAETFSGNVMNAMMLQSMDVQVSTVFATGVAAANLNQQREDMARRYGRRTELPGNLQKYFEENFHGNFAQLERYEMMVPSVYLSTSMKTPLSSLTSSYHTRVLTKSACSPEFEAVMSPLLFSNLEMPQGMKAKLKKGNLLISW